MEISRTDEVCDCGESLTKGGFPMLFYDYRGFTIYPTPRMIPDSESWAIDLSIRHGGNVKVFQTEHSFTTKGEAIFHCINLGKKIIDGEVEEFTVDDI